VTAQKALAFVAYGSQDEKVARIIVDAVARANALPTPIHFEPWVFAGTPGSPLASPILSRIEESTLVVADITYLNLNVIYEIGFAIGRTRRVFLIRDKGTVGDKLHATEAGIFDTLNYFEYTSVDDLKHRLTSHIEMTPLPLRQTVDPKAPIYIIEPPTRDAAAALVTSRSKKAGYRYRSFNPLEDVRLSATDAIRQVACSAGVIISFQRDDVAGAFVHHIRSMFVAGLTHGMGKPLLALAPIDYESPLDIRDSVKSFRHPSDISDHIATFCPDVNNYTQQIDPPPIETGGLLQTLAMGDPTAENEMTTLANYYLRTDQYLRAVRGEVNLVVGRKGSGKTALFIEVRDKIRADKRNVVVDLKPEGYQLLKLKEDFLSFLTEGTRQHLVTAFWEYLLLLEVAYKLLEKERNTYKFNHELFDLYLDLENTYKVANFSTEGDFSERLSALSNRIAEQYRATYGDAPGRKLSAQEVTQLLYAHDIRRLTERVSVFLKRRQAVWILFDNLDKGWSTQGLDVVDATVLRCLIDAGRKLEQHMEKLGHTVHCIVFVRNDVYEHLMQSSADYGKEMRVTLDWTDADLLKELMRLRLVSNLDAKAATMTFPQIWSTVCDSHVRGEDSSNYVVARSLMRPRNVLKIFNHSRGFATNFNHAKIEQDDIDKGIGAFSQDLVIELDRELADVFPATRDLLYHFIDSPCEMSRAFLASRLKEANISESDFDRVIDFLLYHGVLGVRSEGTDYFIYDVHYDIKPLKIRVVRAGPSVIFVVNPAFWSAFGIVESRTETRE